MDQFGITEEMLSVTDDDVSQVLDDIKSFKAELYSNLKDTRFKYNPTRNSELYEAIIAMYGEEFVAQNGYFVTFDMYVQMMEVVKLASKDKADQLLGTFLI